MRGGRAGEGAGGVEVEVVVGARVTVGRLSFHRGKEAVGGAPPTAPTAPAAPAAPAALKPTCEPGACSISRAQRVPS